MMGSEQVGISESPRYSERWVVRSMYDRNATSGPDPSGRCPEAFLEGARPLSWSQPGNRRVVIARGDRSGSPVPGSRSEMLSRPVLEARTPEVTLR